MEEGLKLIVKYEKLLYQARYEYWISNSVFTLRWWILFVLLIVPWYVWYRLIDKKRLKEMLLYIFITSFIGEMLDEIGTSLSLWIYPVKLVPFFTHLITANYSLVPIIFTLVYQYFPRWKSFIVVNIILTFVFSFILEPILAWAKLYVLLTWKHVYSIPVYFIAAVILKWFVDGVVAIQNKYSS